MWRGAQLALLAVGGSWRVASEGSRHSITTGPKPGHRPVHRAGWGGGLLSVPWVCRGEMLPGCEAEVRTMAPHLQALSVEEEDSGWSLRPGRASAGWGWGGNPWLAHPQVSGTGRHPLPLNTQCRLHGSQQGPPSPGLAHPHMPQGLKNIMWPRGPTGEGGREQPVCSDGAWGAGPVHAL